MNGLKRKTDWDVQKEFTHKRPYRLKDLDKEQRTGLTVLLGSIIVLLLTTATMAAAIVVYILFETGIIEGFVVNDNMEYSPILRLLLITTVVSIVIGSMITFILVKVPLKPVNKLINSLNHLAAGDFDTRLEYNGVFAAHPTSRELTSSFNTLAEELQSTEMLRTDFVNNFSHEFRTPIVSISGFTKLLKRGNLTEEQKKEYLDIIEEESKRLSYMATNVLNLTKVENQTILTDVKKYNLSEQIRSCMLILEDKWTKKELELSLYMDEHMIYANEELMKQVWINLLDNAVKFSPEGSTVGVSIREDRDSISVKIMNYGSYIPEDKQDKIFNKFYQADESHSSEGNGVGLAVVKKIIDLHGGIIEVESKNQVTAFTVKMRTDSGLL